MTVPYELRILDAHGNRVATLPGPSGTRVDVDGPAVGVSGLSYHSEGAILDAIGEVAFSLPMGVRRNHGIRARSQVQVFENAVSTTEPVAWGIVSQKSERISRDGHRAEFRCEDVLGELRRATATAGFVAVEEEPLAATVARLLRLQREVAWTAAVDPAIRLDGLTFEAYGQSVYGAIGKLAAERAARITRGRGRTLVFGRMGGDSGLTIRVPTPDPTKGRSIAEMRQAVGLTYVTDAEVTNDLVAVGRGTGVAELTLAPLYAEAGERPHPSRYPLWLISGPAAFAGADPAHPVCRRPREDGGGEDGFEYFIEDTASAATHGRASGRTEANIGAVSDTDADRRHAAESLYQVALAELEGAREPHVAVGVVTEGRGDVRGIAGKTVRLVYREEIAGVVTLAIDDRFTVMAHHRTWDGAIARDEWTLTGSGRYRADARSVVTGALETLRGVTAAPQTYLAFREMPFDDHTEVGKPASRTLHGYRGLMRTLEVLFKFTLQPARSTTRPRPHTHVIPRLTVNIPSLAVPSVAVAVPGQDIKVPAQTLNVPGQTLKVPGQRIELPRQTLTVPGQRLNVPGQRIELPRQTLKVPGQTLTIPSLDVKIPSLPVTSTLAITVYSTNSAGRTALFAKKTSDRVFLETDAANAGLLAFSGFSFTTAETAATEVTKVKTVDTAITTFDTKVTTADTAVTTVDTAITTFDTAVTTADTKVATVDTAVTTVDTKIAIVPVAGTTGKTVTGATTAVTEQNATGASSTGSETGMEFGLFVGPRPSRVWVWVDNGPRLGPFAAGSIDLTPWWTGQGDHTVWAEAESGPGNPTGLCRVQGQVIGRQIVSTIAQAMNG